MFEEVSYIFVVLAGGVLYQTSYDGTEVAITVVGDIATGGKPALGSRVDSLKIRSP